LSAGGGIIVVKPVHEKPIGESGAVRVTRSGSGQTTIEWLKLQYPPEKKEQELAIARSFISVFNASAEQQWKLEALEENDFDFEVSQVGERRYLELQEVIIPGKKRGSPYAGGEQVIQPAKFAKTIVSGIASKGIKYSSKLGQSLDLLVYITHWRFLPNQAVLQLVCDDLHRMAHPFNKIDFFHRLNEADGQSTNLFPSRDLLKAFDRATAEAKTYVNFDPGSGEPYRDGDKVGVRFAVSPETLKKLNAAT
jgi:hypothetical protein